MKKANRLITVLIFIFLYIPMAVLIVASFNTSKDITQFSGFTLKQYAELFRDRDLLALLGNSILISVLASGISTIFGTISAVGIYRMKPRMRSFVMNLTNIPMTNPDIVTGISLSLLFVFIGSKMLGQRDALNFWTLLIAHITFSLPYIILNVMPKLQQMDPALQDAAMDLGCTPVKSFFKVTLPEIMPGVVAGAIMAFTMSLDDFVISYFVSGNDFITLPVEIYTYTKKPIQPKLYAMFTLLFLLIFVLMVTMNLLQIRAEKNSTRRKKDYSMPKWAKAVISCVLALAILVPVGFGIYRSQQKTVLYVSNWGQNIADGSDDTLNIIAEFERRYPHIDVKYSTYDSNESLYSKLSAGGTPVDVIIPSDYMIARLASEGQLMELDFDNIPNFSKVDDRFKNPDYDPENKYSVPYTWGTVGILYNEKYVDPADVTGWELLWNEKYEGKILMFDNSRDAFGIAQYMLGYSVNTTDKIELQACADLLAKQKPLVQQYVMDQIYAAMQDEEAYIAPYYAGDCMCMMQENENLRFYLPENQGFNAFVDAMCVPTCCQNQEAAELFINFMCDPEISGANMDYIWYGSPISEARDYMDEVLATSPVVYPDEEILKRGTSYGFLPEDISRYVESLFMKVRNS